MDHLGHRFAHLHADTQTVPNSLRLKRCDTKMKNGDTILYHRYKIEGTATDSPQIRLRVARNMELNILGVIEVGKVVGL